jgi:hypothetical protein
MEFAEAIFPKKLQRSANFRAKRQIIMVGWKNISGILPNDT